MIRIALFVSICFAFLIPAFAQVQGVRLDAPAPIPEFELSDEKGVKFSRNNMLGQWTIVMFGFNSCPDVCPFTLGNLEHAISETSLRVRPDSVPKVVFVSVDPKRDREHVSDFAKFFHPDFLGVTGEREQIDALVKATDSFYRLLKPDSKGYYEVQHSSSVSVIDPEGMLRAKLQPPFNAGMTAEFLYRLQLDYRKEKAN